MKGVGNMARICTLASGSTGNSTYIGTQNGGIIVDAGASLKGIEIALNAANGAKSSVGDQLHPQGEMDMETYRLIGLAYGELEAKEPWLEGAALRFRSAGQRQLRTRH